MILHKTTADLEQIVTTLMEQDIVWWEKEIAPCLSDKQKRNLELIATGIVTLQHYHQEALTPGKITASCNKTGRFFVSYSYRMPALPMPASCYNRSGNGAVISFADAIQSCPTFWQQSKSEQERMKRLCTVNENGEHGELLRRAITFQDLTNADYHDCKIPTTKIEQDRIDNAERSKRFDNNFGNSHCIPFFLPIL